MKKIIISALAAVALAACTSQAQAPAQGEGATSAPAYDIAYVQAEKAMVENDLYQTEGLPLEEKTRKAQETWAKKQQDIQWQANKLQTDYQKGLITTMKAQQEQERIQRNMSYLESTIQKEGATLEEENMVMLNRTRDLLMRAIEQINSSKEYRMIINASALIDADTTLDITPRVLEVMNDLYKKEKDKPAESK